ncbi:MAG: PorT family protein [Prevotellaceae bacterium]|jgi:hypothetical protein|nr:PorT family protein [Prevotellaceae bacterium]
MKKLILISFLTLFCTVISAQRLGFIGGYQLTTPFPFSYNIYNEQDVNFNAASGSGFHVGGYFDWNIKSGYGLDAQILYSMRTTKFNLHYLSDTTTIFRRNIFSLEVPIHFFLNFPIKKGWTLSPYIGPSLTIGLHGKDIAWENTDREKPVDYQTSDLFDKDNGRLMRFELAGQIGLTAKYRNYAIRTGYSMSLTNLANQKFNWTLPLPSKQKNYLFNGVFSLSFIYVFDLRK